LKSRTELSVQLAHIHVISLSLMCYKSFF